MKLNGRIFCYTENKPTEENLCERDLSLDLGDTGAAVSPPLAGGLWTWRTKRRQEPSVLRLSKVAAESLRCKAGSAAAFALDAVWKHLGRVPPMGTPSAGLKWWHRPFLHHHSLSLRRERALNGEAAVQIYLTVSLVPWNNACWAPVPSQQEAAGNRRGPVRLITKV